MLEDVIVIVAVVHINKEFFFGFITLYTFQAQDVLEDVIVIVAIVHINKEFFFGFIICSLFRPRMRLRRRKDEHSEKSRGPIFCKGRSGFLYVTYRFIDRH